MLSRSACSSSPSCGSLRSLQTCHGWRQTHTTESASVHMTRSRGVQNSQFASRGLGLQSTNPRNRRVSNRTLRLLSHIAAQSRISNSRSILSTCEALQLHFGLFKAAFATAAGHMTRSRGVQNSQFASQGLGLQSTISRSRLFSIRMLRLLPRIAVQRVTCSSRNAPQLHLKAWAIQSCSELLLEPSDCVSAWPSLAGASFCKATFGFAPLAAAPCFICLALAFASCCFFRLLLRLGSSLRRWPEAAQA